MLTKSLHIPTTTDRLPLRRDCATCDSNTREAEMILNRCAEQKASPFGPEVHSHSKPGSERSVLAYRLTAARTQLLPCQTPFVSENRGHVCTGFTHTFVFQTHSVHLIRNLSGGGCGPTDRQPCCGSFRTEPEDTPRSRLCSRWTATTEQCSLHLHKRKQTATTGDLSTNHLFIGQNGGLKSEIIPTLNSGVLKVAESTLRNFKDLKKLA